MAATTKDALTYGRHTGIRLNCAGFFSRAKSQAVGHLEWPSERKGRGLCSYAWIPPSTPEAASVVRLFPTRSSNSISAVGDQDCGTEMEKSNIVRPVPGPLAIILMGVSGCGKSTVGELLSKKLHCQFIDADDFHSAENKDKMKSGIPLTDDDRWPWLETLRDELVRYTSKGQYVVLACSALRSSWRDVLLARNPSGSVIFVYIKGTYELMASRLAARYQEGQHFMPPSLLDSQFRTLEILDGDKHLTSVDASLSPHRIVSFIQEQLPLMVPG